MGNLVIIKWPSKMVACLLKSKEPMIANYDQLDV